MAIVEKGSGPEIDAIATVDLAHEAVALCNLLNADAGLEAHSGLWASLPASVRSSLDQAKECLVAEDDELGFLASLFISKLSPPSVPDRDAKIDWARLFPAAGCPADGCDDCDGCPSHAKARGAASDANQCAVGGSCSCQSPDRSGDEEPCICELSVVGPRWAAALYQTLADTAEVLVDHAENLAVGIEEGISGFPRSLAAQPPQFYLRLAQTCADLCAELAAGRLPVPHTMAELIMLDGAAWSFIEGYTGKDGVDTQAMQEDFGHLPEAVGDFDIDGLWIFQVTDSNWAEIAEADQVFAPNSMNHIFDSLPEAEAWPRFAAAGNTTIANGE
jgi:hypothetical protein